MRVKREKLVVNVYILMKKIRGSDCPHVLYEHLPHPQAADVVNLLTSFSFRRNKPEVAYVIHNDITLSDFGILVN